MKTRQQRLAQERAGHPPSPPQQLADNPRGPRRTRPKKPSAQEEPISSDNVKSLKSEALAFSPSPVAGSGQIPGCVLNQPDTAAAGSVAPAARLTVPGEPGALLQVLVDAGPEASGRFVDDPTLQLATPSSLVPQLLDVIAKKRNQRGEDLLTISSASTHLNPPFDRRQFAHQVGIIPNLPLSPTEPHLQETPRQMEPQIAPTQARTSSPELPPPMAPHTKPARAEPPLQETSRPVAPYNTVTRVQLPLNETSLPRPMAPDNAPPTRTEPPLQQDLHMDPLPCIDQPKHTISSSVKPAYAMHQAVTPSLRDLVDKQKLEQEMPEQEFGESIKPKHTELARDTLSPFQSETANASTPRKRRAFSRKPLMPLQIDPSSHPVPSSPESLSAIGIPAIFRNKHHLPTYTPDGTALYGKVQTTANAPEPNSTPENCHMSQQPHDEADINEESDVEHASESGGTAGPLVESSPQEPAQSIQERTPENLRGSRWSLGSLIESARSVTRRFGFSPLTPVSERSELNLQTQTARKAPMQTKKNSLPTSASAKRAKIRRRIDSVSKPAKPITIGPNKRDQQSPAKKANSASGSTETTAPDAEHSPATSRDQGEARQVQSGESQTTPSIRFPSRSLDKMATKRKRWGSPDTIPNPKGKSYGLGEAEFYENFEEFEQDGVMERQPGKLRRTSESGGFSSQVAGNPHKARPYTGSMFEKSATEYNGGNVFSEYEAARKVEVAAAKMTKTDRQSLVKTPIPVTNSAGTFKVPSPGDSDWSESESDEEVYTAGVEVVPRTVNNDDELESAAPALSPSKVPNPYQIVKPKKSYLESLLNPPSSRVADHTLLERPFGGAAAEPEALRKARDRALQHKPRNPSTLSQSSRTYSSPPVPNEDEMKADKYQSGTEGASEPSTGSNPGLTGQPKFNAYAEWCKTASPAVAAAVGRMEVDRTLAGSAFSAALDNSGLMPDNRPKFNAFDEWSKTAPPAVIAAIGRMEVDPNLAGDAFSGALDNFTNSGKAARQEAALQSTPAASSDTFGSILPRLPASPH